MELLQQQHKSFECHTVGLVNLEHPHLGASPGGVISCACCGTGLLESKCPCKHRDQHPHCVTDPSFYLHQVSGTVVLKTTHDYYVQIQGQMAICKKYIYYCDFVCWTPVYTIATTAQLSHTSWTYSNHLVNCCILLCLIRVSESGPLRKLNFCFSSNYLFYVNTNSRKTLRLLNFFQ